MLPIRGLYEVAIRVKQLPRAEAFYRQVLGLEVGIRDERRNWLFLRAGGEAGMIVLQEDAGQWPTQHFAFTVDEADIESPPPDSGNRGWQSRAQSFINGCQPSRSISPIPMATN